MKKCIIYHTGVYNYADGVIKDNKVYLKGKEDHLYLPEEMFMAREECEGGFIQFEVEGKWGFADIYTGEIIINPVWDYGGPFYRGYAHVALGVELEIHGGYHIEMKGGKHGYIGIDGEIIIPLEYDDAEEIPYRKHFKVFKDGKWGMVDSQNKTMIPFKWVQLETSYENDLIFCAIEETCELHVGAEDKLLAAILNIQSEPTRDYTLKWGVYDQNFSLIVQPELDEKPIRPTIKYSSRSENFSCYEKYYILKRKKKYGILCNDGRWIANIELSKAQATAMINTISRFV